MLFALSWLALLCSLSTCSPRMGVMQQILSSGLLRIASTNSPTTYYVGPSGPTGFEYDLAAAFAQDLGVSIEVRIAQNAADALDMVRNNRAHFAAAAVTVTPERQQSFRFTRPVNEVVPQLIYRLGTARPEDPSQISRRLVVTSRSAAIELLTAMQADFPALEWEETEDYETEELLIQVHEGTLDHTVANSDVLAINRRYFPRLAFAFDLAETQHIAWAFLPSDDAELFRRADEFLSAFSQTELSHLHDRHFGHVERLDYVGAVTLATHMETRLPKYQALFEAAAEELEMDWRLLAAIGYQESHWDPKAVSPTGVKGIMQLTLDTAKFMNVSNREDPAQSIRGGSRYIKRMIDKLPDVEEPDRTWLALSAYNMGWGHLRDVQAITQMRGGNPKRWIDIRENLPLLTQSRWHRKTKYGYARGHEAQTFVGNIRTYYDMLMFMTGEEPPAQDEPPPPRMKDPKDDNPLNIRAPIL